MTISKQDLFRARPTVHEFDVKGLGEVAMKELPSTAMLAFAEEAGGEDESTTNQMRRSVQVALQCLVDSDGNRLVADHELEESARQFMEAHPLSVVKALVQHAMEVMGMGDGAMEDAVEGFSEAPSGPSSSS